jgi:FkbM family methyltransferase
MVAPGFDPVRDLQHHDPSQLWFQIREIFEEKTYLRHGVTVGPGDTVLDVGANVGVAAAFFAHECGATTVHSFEPVRPVFDLLVKNVGRFPACTAHNLGLSDRPGDVAFTYYPGAAAMSSRYADPQRDGRLVRDVLVDHGVDPELAERQVEGDFEGQPVTCHMTTVSEFLAEQPIEAVDLLKIDVERAEFDVLAGILDEDWHRVRQVVVEVHDFDGRLARMRSLLRDRGFEVFAVQEEIMRSTDVNVVYAVRA